MAKRISQSAINWAALAERVGPDQKGQFALFKARSDLYLRRMLANPEEPPKIDWEYYKPRVSVQGMVDSFKSAYESLKIPYPEDTLTSQIEEQEIQVKAEIGEFKKLSNGNIATHQASIAYIESLLPFEEMTMEDFREAFPDIALDPINKPTFWPHDDEEQQPQSPAAHH